GHDHDQVANVQVFVVDALRHGSVPFLAAARARRVGRERSLASRSAPGQCGSQLADRSSTCRDRVPRAVSAARIALMRLPVNPPVLPMLAKRVDALPSGGGYLYEPKWDGFRVLVFRDGDELLLQSRDEKPLDRYFPELRAPLLAQLPSRCALDGELVIAGEEGLDFEALQMRIHPAASRVERLARELPAQVVFWD